MDRVSSVTDDIQRSLKGLRTRYLEDDFQYHPLRSPSEIRLLRIQPGRPSDGISCSVRVVSLDENPEYTALSYTWRRQHSEWSVFSRSILEFAKGIYQRNLFDMQVQEAEAEDRTPKTILCNGRRLDISLNLYGALLLLRKSQPSNVEYWIDAICINQSHTKEKNAQVRMMGRIYQSAHLVIVWLGDCSSKLAQGLPDLETLAKKPQSELPSYYHSYEGSNTDFQAAARTAAELLNRQWFKRIWVLQEFILAKQVMLLYGECQVSLESLLTAFKWIYHDPGAVLKPELPYSVSKKEFGTGGISHISDPLSTLLARQTITQGRMLTLREWLQACETRHANDPRDFVFSGLSLIQPDSLNIDNQRLQSGGYVGFDIKPPPLPPRPGTHAHNGNLSTVEQSRATVGSSTLLPTPQGLWSTLMVDYTASEEKVFVNFAACLLSQKGQCSIDLLSIAARPRGTIDLEESWVKSRPNANPALPSWVPALGSWESLVHSNLAEAAEAAGGGGKAFAAGMLGQPQEEGLSPRISRDGTTLFLDVAPLDTVGDIILDDALKKKEYVRILIQFLETVAGMPHAYLPSNGTSFDAIATTLASLLSSSRNTELDVVEGQHVEQTPLSSPASPGQCARLWLCEFIDSEVRHWVTYLRMTRDELACARGVEPSGQQWSEEVREKRQKWVDGLVSAYWQLNEKFDDLPWSGTATQGMVVPETATSQPNKITSKLWDLMDAIESSVEEAHFIWMRKQPMSLMTEQYVAAFYCEMRWRSLFRTKDGLIGMGPSWLTKGDRVMLVKGAIVPYVFRHVDEELRPLVEKMQEKEKIVEECANKHGLSESTTRHVTEEQIAKLKQAIDRLQAGRKDAWVLIGEAYVEGVMRGEVVEREGSGIFERIAIV